MWQEQAFELYVKATLESERPLKATRLWADYVVTRDEIVRHVLPYIAAQEPTLTDHGVDHVANVVRNLGRVLGFLEGRPAAEQEAPLRELDPEEKLLLLLGALLHDVGNVLGREKHNLVGQEVWQQSGVSYERWNHSDRRAIMAICRAHTGRGIDGGRDTLRELVTSQHFFSETAVKTAALAAILRFADELAEGEQRTSQFLLRRGLFPEPSVNYHAYADITTVNIDYRNGRIALSFDVDTEAAYMGQTRREKKNRIKALLNMVFSRVMKLDHERRLARHYAPLFLNYRETSVAIHFHSDGAPHGYELAPLVINDFNASDDPIATIKAISPAYDVDKIIRILLPWRR